MKSEAEKATEAIGWTPSKLLRKKSRLDFRGWKDGKERKPKLEGTGRGKR